MILVFLSSYISLILALSLDEFVGQKRAQPVVGVPSHLKKTISDKGRQFVQRSRRGEVIADPSCGKLKAEYDQVCFVLPPAAALVETKAFCDAYAETCAETLKQNVFTNLESIEIDFTRYCRIYRERFRYVCPDPLRFHTYADDALAFCARYIERCPNEELPGEPVQFKDPLAGHIYIREIEAFCKPLRRWARNYCTDPDLIKVPKYAVPCYIFKVNCIDVYAKVIYG